jgi:AcrR family transcriptional regulator
LSKKELTKQKIINTAIRSISTLGFNATTTALIAREAGLSETLIFKYFKNKQNLLHEIGNLAVTQVFENISIIPLMENINQIKDYPLREFLFAIAMERFQFIEKNMELIRIMIMEMQYSNNLLEQVSQTLFPKVFEATAVVQQIVAAKLKFTPMQARAITRIWIGTFLSLAVQKYFLNLKFQPGEIERELENVLDFIENSVK